MLRVAAITAVLLALPAAAFGARRVDAPTAGAVVAKVISCEVAAGSDRSATFYARMDALANAAKMSVRFQLFERLGRDDAWTRVDVPALRGWRTSQPGVKRFGWKQNVGNLSQGGAYRARIQYRWISASGAVLETASKDTPVCRGPQPNPQISDVSVRRGPTDDTRVYRVEIDNPGTVDVDDLEVSLSVDRAVLDTVTVSRLDGGTARTVSFTGPACRREIRVELDPDNAVGERSELDNSQVFACP